MDPTQDRTQDPTQDPTQDKTQDRTEAETKDLIARYIAVWNEPDAERRRDAIAALWAPGGSTSHRLLESRGLAAIEERVRNAHVKWVVEKDYEFRAGKHALGHHGVLMFNWGMWSKASGELVSGGLDFLQFDDDGLIRTDHQFPEPS
ncbi:MAG: SnoaL-like domain protein [Variovorax sp.]|nr:SnoaL-like domain protein [Variovorax sp.]